MSEDQAKYKLTDVPVIELPNGMSVEIWGSTDMILWGRDGKSIGQISAEDLINMITSTNDNENKPGHFVYRAVWEE